MKQKRKLTDLKPDECIIISNIKEAKQISKLLRKKNIRGCLSGSTCEAKNISLYSPNYLSIDNTGYSNSEDPSEFVIHPKQFLASKKSTRKKLKELDKRLKALEFKSELEYKIKISQIEKKEKQPFMLPEKWCVKHSSESLEWIRKNAELNGNYITERSYYMFPKNESGNNSSTLKPLGYTEITTEQFIEHVLKREEEAVSLEVGKWYKKQKAASFAIRESLM